MRNRWLIYVAIGLCFGFADWYFLDLLASLGQNQALNGNLLQAPGYIRIIIVMVFVISNYGVWLIPVIPTAIYEMKRLQSLRRAAISAVIVWSSAMLSYYAYYAFMLMFVGLPNMDFMLFSNRQSATYWADWWPPFQRVILAQFIDWIGIAVIGGVIVGTLSAYVFNLASKRRRQREPL
jgi:hypothetical protein